MPHKELGKMAELNYGEIGGQGRLFSLFANDADPCSSEMSEEPMYLEHKN